MGGKCLSRREFVAGLTMAGGAALLAACTPPATPEVVEKQVVVKETVVVQGTPEVVEKVVTATVAPVAPPEAATIRFSAWSCARARLRRRCSSSISAPRIERCATTRRWPLARSARPRRVPA